MKKILSIFILLFFSHSSFAQIDSCNVFLQGRYVEVGINWNGAYGTSTSVPMIGYCGTAYHDTGGAVAMPRSSSCGGGCYNAHHNLGFVADPVSS